MPKKKTEINVPLEDRILQADRAIHQLIKSLVAWDDYRNELTNSVKGIGTTPPGTHPPLPPGTK